MQLSSSPEQQAALEELLAGQHDPASPHFQEWLTPEQFGERFGPAQQDIDAVAGWLQANGFRVDDIGRGRRTLEFSGTASQVEQAFHTEMHQYDVAGERHLANSMDLAIPEALAPVIAGMAGLHDFRRQPMHRVLSQALYDPATDLTGGTHGLSPYDFAAIYNVTPLWNTRFDGTGQSVAIAGRTNIKLSDVATFRSTFGLPSNNPQVILNGRDPGIVSSGEEMEADLDVEWSGAVAKGAAIKFVVSASTNASDGIDLSNQYIVNNNLAPVMSVSFGACEAAMGAGNQFYNSLWQQAAAQGISVFISTGDSGSAGCDSPGAHTPASHGLGVNGMASTPYNVAVGGTQFADTANPATWWNTGNDANYASAKGYIPETAWNESSYTSANATSNNLYAGSGGVSSVYATPVWQAGKGVPANDPGAAAQHHRYLPDVSLAAAGHEGYLVFHEGGLYMVGGTSASSPAFAGLMAIVDQYTGGRNGNPNTRFYSLADQVPAAWHDVTAGTIAVPCSTGSPACSTSAESGTVGVMTGYAAAQYYDLATGLGSVDAYVMASNWGARPAAGPAIISLSPNPMTAASAIQTLTITGSGFLANAKVTATYPGFSTSLQVTSLSATQIQSGNQHWRHGALLEHHCGQPDRSGIFGRRPERGGAAGQSGGEQCDSQPADRRQRRPGDHHQRVRLPVRHRPQSCSGLSGLLGNPDRPAGRLRQQHADTGAGQRRRDGSRVDRAGDQSQRARLQQRQPAGSCAASAAGDCLPHAESDGAIRGGADADHQRFGLPVGHGPSRRA